MSSSRRAFRLLAALSVLGVGMLAQSEARSGPEPSSADVDAIRAVLKRQEADWNRGDLESFLTGYWHSPKLVFQSGGSRHDGWESMRDRYIKRYKSEGRSMGTVAFSSVDIELLGPDAAFVRGNWGLTLPDGSRPDGLFTLVFRKFNDGWKIIHDHTSMRESAQPVRKP